MQRVILTSTTVIATTTATVICKIQSKNWLNLVYLLGLTSTITIVARSIVNTITATVICKIQSKNWISLVYLLGLTSIVSRPATISLSCISISCSLPIICFILKIISLFLIIVIIIVIICCIIIITR